LTASLSATGQDLTGIKCVLDGESQVDSAASVDYRGGKVYFCCEDCAGSFKSKMSDTSSDLLVKANHQLVLTGQFAQTACPLTGKPVAADKTVDVGGVKVAFCCGGCQGAVNKEADLAGKAKLVFANTAFEKGFAAKQDEPKLDGLKCFIMPKKDVKKEISADYGDHKVYFCCKSCVRRFSKDNAKYATQANQHLVVTEQVKQSACPISGQPTKDDQSTEVNGVTVKFCCEKCKGKVDGAADSEKAELVFGKDAFAKGFK
jgi:YHS domain-containing protein